MIDASNRPGPSKPGKKANIPLILAVAGVALGLLGENVKDETASYAVFALGVGCTILAILSVIFWRKNSPES